MVETKTINNRKTENTEQRQGTKKEKIGIEQEIKTEIKQEIKKQEKLNDFRRIFIRSL